MTNLEGKIQKR